MTSRIHSSTTAALFTDLYELTMVQAYLNEGMQSSAVFELYFRSLPEHYNYIVAAGLESTLEFLENLRFAEADLEYLRQQGQFADGFLEELKQLRFTGDVYAPPEGTLVFPNEPLIQVVAPLPQAQLVETLVLNQIHFASLAASTAARHVLAADGRKVVDFGSRRAHGTDAALIVARSAYLAGVDGTSLVEAGRRFGIPIFGTMAHSYVQAHDDEQQAFTQFSNLYPDTTLLVDTYDTLQGVDKVIALSRELGERFSIRAVRLDSGDLAELATQARHRLDEAGLDDVQIFASGGLDEYALAEYSSRGVPIDAYGVGTALAVSEHAPSLDMAYKLVEYDGRPRTKLSSEKLIYPLRKQVFRQTSGEEIAGDVLTTAAGQSRGEALLRPVMRRGKRLPQMTLEESREHCRAELRRLPASIRSLSTSDSPYPVKIDPSLEEELQQLRKRLAKSQVHGAGDSSQAQADNSLG